MSKHEDVLKKIEEALEKNKDLADCDIDASFENGEATLLGRVKNATLSEKAEEVVARVPGVETVHNEIRVEKDGHSRSEHEKQGSGYSSGYDVGEKKSSSQQNGARMQQQQEQQQQDFGGQRQPESGMREERQRQSEPRMQEERQRQPEKGGQPRLMNEGQQGGQPQGKSESKARKR